MPRRGNTSGTHGPRALPVATISCATGHVRTGHEQAEGCQRVLAESGTQGLCALSAATVNCTTAICQPHGTPASAAAHTAPKLLTQHCTTHPHANTHYSWIQPPPPARGRMPRATYRHARISCCSYCCLHPRCQPLLAIQKSAINVCGYNADGNSSAAGAAAIAIAAAPCCHLFQAPIAAAAAGL